MATVTFSFNTVATQVLATDSGSQALPAVTAAGTSGLNWYAAWNEASLAYVSGTWAGVPFSPLSRVNSVVNTTTTNNQFDPDIGRLLNGNTVTTFSDGSGGVANPVIRAVINSPTGGVVLNDFVIGTGDGIGGNRNSSVGTASGRFMTAWEDFDTATDRDIYYSVFNSLGGVVKANTGLKVTGADEFAPSVAGLTTGGFVAVWVARAAALGSPSQVFGQRFDVDGNLVGGQFDVAVVGQINDQPAVVGLPGGGFAVIVRENYPDGGGTTDVTLERFDVNANSLGFARLNGNPTGANEGEGSVGVLGNGMILAANTVDPVTQRTTQYYLINPADGTILATSFQGGYQGEIAGLSDGFAALVTAFDATDRDLRMTILQAQRTTLGDGTNELLQGDVLRDVADGQGGIDTFVFQGARAGHTIGISGANVSVVDTVPNRDGSDSLANIERGRFSDGTVAFDINLPGEGPSNAGSAYRLYEAAFNRTPDNAGLAFWIKSLDNGTTRLQAAQGFVNSGEYVTTYGANPTATNLVNQFYNNILGRAPEAAGFNFWFNVLNGQPQNTALVLDGIANSAENQAGLIATIGQGIFVPGNLLF